jgi:hypothetical protein
MKKPIYISTADDKLASIVVLKPRMKKPMPIALECPLCNNMYLNHITHDTDEMRAGTNIWKCPKCNYVSFELISSRDTNNLVDYLSTNK